MEKNEIVVSLVEKNEYHSLLNDLVFKKENLRTAHEILKRHTIVTSLCVIRVTDEVLIRMPCL